MKAVTRIVQEFLTTNSAPGVLLCVAAVLAVFMENSPLYGLYDAIKDTPVVLQVGAFAIDKPLLLWINDGLMAIFFLLVGLEIKREVLEGHLSKPDQFILPAVAAVGGVVVPAFIYAYINWHDTEMLKGWAIPAATDIAFALGILMLLGNRIPVALKVCLVAIAIIDDLAAIIIIALFYTADTSLISLGLAGVGLTILFLLNLQGVTRLGPYVVLGLFIWACVLKSGVHATLAGVAIGLLIPLRARNEDGKPPLKVMEHALHPWVAFGILPIFAFANAGVSLAGLSLDTFMQPITLGIILGLFFGKQIGVMGLTTLAVSLKICRLPEGVTWSQFYGMALLTGVGFTMSLFIGTLAFTNVDHASAVRFGVLGGSILSALAGVIVLLINTKKNNTDDVTRLVLM
jgi:NhaA family Na+:H+ antiporter